MGLAAILSAIGANIELLHIILFAVGIICMVIELFEPGMGVFGIVGVIVMVIDIFVLADNIVQGIVLFAGLAILVLVFVIVLLVLSSHGLLPRGIILKDSTSNGDGYVASPESSVKVGDTGVAMTHLRPAGKAELGYIVADVMSDGEFIERGSLIKVISVNGGRITVREIDED